MDKDLDKDIKAREKAMEKLYHIMNKYLISELEHLKKTMDKEVNEDTGDLTGNRKTPDIKKDGEIKK